MDKVKPCIGCGDLIFPATAEENEGLCHPCLEEQEVVDKDWPHQYAFWAASLLLLINAGFTIFQMSHSGISAQHVFPLILDLALALFLFQEDEIARNIALLRAAIGLVIPVAMRAMDSVSGGVIETGITQILFCGAILLFLGWKTVRWRMFTGALFGLLYTMYLGLIVVTLVF